MRPKRVSATMSKEVYDRLRGACLLHDIPIVDALEFGAFLVCEQIRTGWRPEKRVRDMATGMEEMP